MSEDESVPRPVDYPDDASMTYFDGAHINCRSVATPVLKSWKELGINLKEAPEGTRASLPASGTGKQVPASLNYNDWLKTQPKEFQDDVLGVKKGQLFRKAGL